MHDRYPDVEEDCGEHPMTVAGIVLLASAIVDTTDTAELVRFTGYSKDFISAITFNMENNGIWFNGHYRVAECLRPNETIDDDSFWQHIEIACGMLRLPGAYTETTADPCDIYWKEQ